MSMKDFSSRTTRVACKNTYMICNMNDLSSRLFMLDRYHISKAELIDFHIYIEGATEGGNLHVVTVGTALGHLLQVAFKDTVNFLRSRSSSVEWC